MRGYRIPLSDGKRTRKTRRGKARCKSIGHGYADARDVLNTKLSRATNNYTLKSIRRQIYNSSNDTAIVYKDESDNEITLEVDLSEEALYSLKRQTIEVLITFVDVESDTPVSVNTLPVDLYFAAVA